MVALPANARFEVIDVVDAQAGEFRVRTLENRAPAMDYNAFEFLESKVNGRTVGRMGLREALLQQPDAGNMLRDGIRLIAFSEYQGMPITYPTFTRIETSNKKEEYWLRDGTLGRIPRNPSGNPAPRLTRRIEGSAVIENHKYDAISEILGDDIRFDRLNILRQEAEKMGRSARVTEEAEVYEVITNTANYTRSNTTGDNDVGANTQTWELTHENFEKASAIIGTAKDRTSGLYLGLMPDTMVVGPLMKFPAMKLLNSGGITAAGTAGAVTQVGDLNVYRGSISRIIVCPFLTTSYDWALADTRVPGVQFQVVEPFNVYQTTPTPDNQAWLNRDVIEYKVMGYFGTGFVDDRPWFYSVTSTRPTL